MDSVRLVPVWRTAAKKARPPNIFRRVRRRSGTISPVTKQWECVICGYIHEGEEPPDICPVCDAPKEFFRLLGD